MSSYASVEEFKDWLDDDPRNLVDGQGADIDARMTRLLEAASRSFETDTGRIFYKQTSASRTYYPDPAGFVQVVDLLSATSITIDANGDGTPETVLATTDYRLLPKTGGHGGIAVARYQRIESELGSSYRFYQDRPVAIVGNWGWVETYNGVERAPADVTTAVLILSTRMLMRRSAKLGRAVIPESGVSEGLAKLDPDYQAIVQRYMHPSVAWGLFA
mgnify:CR=1 FL=1